MSEQMAQTANDYNTLVDTLKRVSNVPMNKEVDVIGKV
jgi:hypothetical protein